MKRKDVCGECGAHGPDASTTSTMAASGWRLASEVDEAGTPRVCWYCPTCWENKTGTAPLQAPRGKR